LVHLPGSISPVRIERLAEGGDAAHCRRVMGQVLAGGGEVLKQDGPARVVAMEGVVVKARPTGGPVGWLRAVLGIAKEDREWAGTLVLASAGVRTARAVAIARSGGWSGSRALLVERLDGPTMLRVLGQARPLVEERALAAALAGSVGGLWRAGWWNRDAKPSNWIVARLTGGSAEVAAIDLGGLRRARGGEGWDRMLASLVLEPLGLGILPRRAHLWRCLAGLESARGGGDARRTWRRVAALVAAHGDPRPRIDPRGR
jgi:hypothetical protein